MMSDICKLDALGSNVAIFATIVLLATFAFFPYQMVYDVHT